MKKTLPLFMGRRFQNSLVIATTVLSCAALQAEDQDKTDQQQRPAQGAGQSGQTGQSDQQTEKFVQNALVSGKMEVQMGELAQQRAQNQQVKSLGAALVRDHSQANQKLQQIASTKSISQTHAGARDHQQKHEKQLEKLRGQSGAEFDKEFVTMALKHHKKDIQQFEKAQTQVNDPQLKSFISETLPKLREHYQMAQAAAQSVGVDEASIAADVDVDTDSAVGGAQPAESGPREKSPISDRPVDRPRSSLDGATESDASATINQNTPSIDADAKLGDREFRADADVDVDDASVDADVDTDKDGGIFEKGDGKVLGLPTDKNDGKFLGIIPNPRANNDDGVDADADIEADVDVDTDDTSVGGAASVETGSSKKDR